MWVQNKAQKEGVGPWTHLVHTSEVLELAHRLASRHYQSAQNVVDVNDFRTLLVNIFAISVLHVHFSMADDWREGADFGNNSPSFEEFRLACRSITAAHANEDISDEQLYQDFTILDKNRSNSIAFEEVRDVALNSRVIESFSLLQVCDYCCETMAREIFVNDHQNMFLSTHVVDESDERGVGLSLPVSARSVVETATVVEPCWEIKQLLANNFSIYPSLSIHTRNSLAVAALDEHLLSQKGVATFIEVKHNTENEVLKAIGGFPQ